MTDYRSLYGREYIGAWSLGDKDVTITITAVKGGELIAPGNKSSKRPVVSIKGTDKKLVLNVSNGRTIANLYGPLVENWVNKRVTLYRSTTRNPDGGGQIDCVRIRPIAPPVKGAAPELVVPPDADPSPAHQSAVPLGDAETTGASQPQPGAAAAPSDLEALRILIADWCMAIRDCDDARALTVMADSAPDKVKITDEFAAAVNARLDQLKEKMP